VPEEVPSGRHQIAVAVASIRPRPAAIASGSLARRSRTTEIVGAELSIVAAAGIGVRVSPSALASALPNSAAVA
jgi:hypothetical protein